MSTDAKRAGNARPKQQRHSRGPQHLPGRVSTPILWAQWPSAWSGTPADTPQKRREAYSVIEFWYCPIFDKEIDEGLCWDISNIGNDSLCLSADERPPCGWEEAYKICKACQHYAECANLI